MIIRHYLKSTEESFIEFPLPPKFAARIIIPPLEIYLFELINFSMVSEKVTMEIRILMERQKNGSFCNMGSYFQRTSLNGVPQRGALGNQRPVEGMAVLWESGKVSDSASGAYWRACWLEQ